MDVDRKAIHGSSELLTGIRERLQKSMATVSVAPFVSGLPG
jgi:hypothetical protein